MEIGSNVIHYLHNMFETKKRSSIKTLTWKVVATLITLSTTYVFTNNFIGSVKITVVAAIIGLISFYIHERIWNRIKWGKTND